VCICVKGDITSFKDVDVIFFACRESLSLQLHIRFDSVDVDVDVDVDIYFLFQTTTHIIIKAYATIVF
jgi:hypothetical protein